jgi:small subunit ribosomal protein S8
MQDPIADMFTRIRNALAVGKKSTRCQFTKAKQAILNVLQEQGYLNGFSSQVNDAGHNELLIELKYYADKPVINKITRLSKPSLRVYKSAADIPEVKNGLGICIVTTPAGVMTGRQAKQKNVGGEIIGFVD